MDDPAGSDSERTTKMNSNGVEGRASDFGARITSMVLLIAPVLQGRLDEPPLFLNLPLELFLRGQAHHVFGGKDLLAII